MQENSPALQEILGRVKTGEISPEDAAKAIEGLRIGQVGDYACIDLGRQARCGMPEVILAEGKEPEHLAEIAVRHAKAAGRCVVTRASPEQAAMVQERAYRDKISCDYRSVGRVLVLSTGAETEKTGGVVAIVTAGTSDIRVAEEAKVIAEEMGCEVRTAYDVGVAGIHRLFPALKSLMDADVFVVCAGREGTLPAIIAGLVDRPVIGVPVSSGYGYMGQGKAALASMLQSCSVVAVVNTDADFTAGAFAARVANQAAKQAGPAEK